MSVVDTRDSGITKKYDNSTMKAMMMRSILDESEDSGSEGNSVSEKTLRSRVKGIIG